MPTKNLYSLYSFYQKHFGYPSAASDRKRINFGKAIAFSERAIRECFDIRDLDIIANYAQRPWAHPLTVNFLNNFLVLLQAYSPKPLYDLEYYLNKLTIDAPQNINRYSRIHVHFTYLHNASQGDFIVVVYGPSINAMQEIAVFRALANYASLNFPLPRNIRRVHYWNVRDNQLSSYDISNVPTVPWSSILSTINTI